MPISSEKKYTKLAKKILQDYKQTFSTNLYKLWFTSYIKVHRYFMKWSSSILLNADNGFDKFSLYYSKYICPLLHYRSFGWQYIIQFRHKHCICLSSPGWQNLVSQKSEMFRRGNKQYHLTLLANFLCLWKGFG